MWRPTLETFPDTTARRVSISIDEEAIAAVDKFRAAQSLNYQGNPPGLVDARFIEALRAAYLKKEDGW